MKFTHIVCHYGEIALKGNNRRFFENKLTQNIKSALKKAEIDFTKVSKINGRIFVELSSNPDYELIKATLRKVFGLVNFSLSLKIEKDMNLIKEKILTLLKETEEFNTFKIQTSRSDKSFPLNSQEVNEEIGEYVLNNLDKQVDLTSPDKTVYIEITKNSAFIYLDKVSGYGGLPVSTGGKALSLMSGGIDSPVASWLIAKRGVKIDYIHFHSYPFTNKASIEKTKDVIKVLKEFQLGKKLYLVPFAKAQKEIVAKSPAKFRIVLYRRFMMRIAEKIAEKNNYKALITGESVGQVASQTLENIRAIGEVAKLPILRPISGMNKQEVINISKDIGTFNISIRSCQDTCSWFMPDNPSTKSDINEARSAEADLDIDKIVSETIESINEVQV